MLGTFIETRSFSLASSATTTFSHGLGQQPHMVWATAQSGSAAPSAASSSPVIALRANATNVTVAAYGTSIVTGTACIAFFHSIIQ